MERVLKYPGSKWNIARQLVGLMPEHHSYVEPFFGSGALLFSKPPSDIETVNDLDSEVVNLFRCIQQDAGRLARLVATTTYSREVYEGKYGAGAAGGYASRYLQAAGFLVRCWQGHGFRTCGGKVGWKNDVAGRERAYSVWDWYRLPGRIVDVAERLRRVQIECRPALEVIRRFDHPGVFMYLDPPYIWGVRARKQYRHEMWGENEHGELLDAILGSRAKIMISGYESELYSRRLKGWRKETFRSCAEKGRPREEVVWMNYSGGQQATIFDWIGEVGTGEDRAGRR